MVGFAWPIGSCEYPQPFCAHYWNGTVRSVTSTSLFSTVPIVVRVLSGFTTIMASPSVVVKLSLRCLAIRTTGLGTLNIFRRVWVSTSGIDLTAHLLILFTIKRTQYFYSWFCHNYHKGNKFYLVLVIERDKFLVLSSIQACTVQRQSQCWWFSSLFIGFLHTFLNISSKRLFACFSIASYE